MCFVPRLRGLLSRAKSRCKDTAQQFKTKVTKKSEEPSAVGPDGLLSRTKSRCKNTTQQLRRLKNKVTKKQQNPSADGTDIQTPQTANSTSSEDVVEDSDPWMDYEYPPLDLNHEALKHIATSFLGHGKCTAITTLGRGAFHEIKEVMFEDGFCCIGRFTRDPQEACSVLESATATAEYVRNHTSIPVPETYFVNSNPNHVVGASFVLMEKLPGKSLYQLWPDLVPYQKLDVMEQIADVVVQLSQLKFDKIGSLRPGGEIGPLQSLAYSYHENGRGPFANLSEWASSFLQPYEEKSDELMNAYADSEMIIHQFLQRQPDNPILQGPYSLIHGDFDMQNMLFTYDEEEDDSPRLSGIIDWDQSYSGPLYQLLEYPQFIRDNSSEETNHLYGQNSALRKYFVYKLSRHFSPDSQEREDVLECFRQKSYTLNAFRNMFATVSWNDAEWELMAAEGYVDGHTPRIGADWHAMPYDGPQGEERDAELQTIDLPARGVDSDDETENESENGSENESDDNSDNDSDNNDDDNDDEREDQATNDRDEAEENETGEAVEKVATDCPNSKARQRKLRRQKVLIRIGLILQMAFVGAASIRL